VSIIRPQQICPAYYVAVWKNWQIFQNSKFHQMRRKINKFIFISVYSGLNGRKAISPIETE